MLQRTERELDLKAFEDMCKADDADSRYDDLLITIAARIKEREPWLHSDEVASRTCDYYESLRSELLEIKNAKLAVAIRNERGAAVLAGVDSLVYHSVNQSAVHRFCDALLANRVLMRGEDSTSFEYSFVDRWQEPNHNLLATDWVEWFRSAVPFLIQHDWLNALNESVKPLLDDEWRTPFGRCVFEFAISQAADRPRAEMKSHCLSFFLENTRTHRIRVFEFMEIDGVWIGHTFFDMDPNLRVKGYRGRHFDFIRAACIAIDANIAEAIDVAAPAKLNKARAKKGKSPLPDFKIIRLAREHRERAEVGALNGRHVRLHLRRGHFWPRVNNEKTRFAAFRHWRPWRLVGDPDLGFIEHEYRI
jgi:hypothetical protein